MWLLRVNKLAMCSCCVGQAFETHRSSPEGESEKKKLCIKNYILSLIFESAVIFLNLYRMRYNTESHVATMYIICDFLCNEEYDNLDCTLFYLCIVA